MSEDQPAYIEAWEESLGSNIAAEGPDGPSQNQPGPAQTNQSQETAGGSPPAQQSANPDPNTQQSAGGGESSSAAPDKPQAPTIDEQAKEDLKRQLRDANPQATPEEFEKIFNNEVEKKNSSLKEDYELQQKILDKVKVIENDPANKDLSDEEKIAKAKELYRKELENPDVLGSLLEDFQSSEASKAEQPQLDLGKLASNIIIEGEPLKVEGNSVESLQEAINNRVEAIKQSQEEFNNLGSEEKRLVNLLNREGLGGLNKFMNPDQEIKELIQLPDEQKIAMWLTQREQAAGKTPTEEDIADMIADLKDEEIGNGKSMFDRRLREINDGLKEQHYRAQQEVLNRSERRYNREQESEREQIRNRVSAIHQEIDKLDSITKNIKIPDGMKTYLKGAFTEENYKKMSTSPKILALAHFYNTFGEKMIESIERASFEKGRSKGLDISLNIPRQDEVNHVNTQNQSTSAPDDGDKRGGFDAWQEGLDRLRQNQQ